MIRLGAYLAIMIGSLTFWVIQLLLNYRMYVDNDPYSLGDEYQRSLITFRSPLLIAELLFPAGMVVAFVLLLIFKLAARTVRVALGFVLFLCMEFWMWRTFIFDQRIEVYYLQSETDNPMLVPPHQFMVYMIGFGVVFAVVLFLREYALENDPDRIHDRLKQDLEKGDWG
jgi:hypothetical protein